MPLTFQTLLDLLARHKARLAERRVLDAIRDVDRAGYRELGCKLHAALQDWKSDGPPIGPAGKGGGS